VTKNVCTRRLCGPNRLYTTAAIPGPLRLPHSVVLCADRCEHRCDPVARLHAIRNRYKTHNPRQPRNVLLVGTASLISGGIFSYSVHSAVTVPRTLTRLRTTTMPLACSFVSAGRFLESYVFIILLLSRCRLLCDADTLHLRTLRPSSTLLPSGQRQV
jgi:hypothetical protein